MKFTKDSGREDVRKFLECHFAYLPDGLEPNFEAEIRDEKKRHRGRQPDLERLSAYEQIEALKAVMTTDKAVGVTVTQMKLSEKEDKHDTVKRGFSRYKNRTDPLLNSKRNYGNQDFCKAILAKRFDIAEAIFFVSGPKETEQIVKNLNSWSSAN